MSTDRTSNLSQLDMFLKTLPLRTWATDGVSGRQLELFEAGLPRYLYAADDFARGLYRFPKVQALTKRFVEANPGKVIRTLTYDIDRPGAAHDWNLRDAPAPSITVENRENGHAHAIYLLSWPVLKVADGEPASRALRYMAAVQEGLRQRLEADPSYSGLMVKNPRSDYWGVLTWWEDLYDLDALAAKVERELEHLTDRRKRLPDIGLGRNHNLFNDVRRWAYRVVRLDWSGYDSFRYAVRDRTVELNTFTPPLPDSEVRSIAKSVAGWTWERRESFARGFNLRQATCPRRQTGPVGRPGPGAPSGPAGLRRAWTVRPRPGPGDRDLPQSTVQRLANRGEFLNMVVAHLPGPMRGRVPE